MTSRTYSTPSCCNSTLEEREKLHPASFRGYSNAKGELQRARAQRDPKGSSGRKLFSKATSLDHFFAAALPQICTLITTDTSDYHIYRADRFPGRKGGTAVAVRKDISHNYADLPPFVLTFKRPTLTWW
jgi:hypothetical protein